MNAAHTAFPYDYARVEAVIAGLLPAWRLAGFDAVVAIARGGLVPGVIVSTGLSLPLYALQYSRGDSTVSWFTVERPASACRILLVEDIAGRGTTLSDSLAFLQAQRHEVSVFTLAYDTQSRITPDCGLKIPDGYRAWFPWERESITPAFDATSNRPDRPEHEYASWAIDLDGILLMDLPEQEYAEALQATLTRRDQLLPNPVLPQLDLANVTIITGRPEQDRLRTQAWLNRHGFNGPLIMRNETRHAATQTAVHKAEAILSRCHTHFIESDPIQALDIACRAQVARVLWWNGTKAMMVFANEVDHLHAI
ncbi:MAG TPA: phosphoribosyltransferase family protein [Candidimonas sp.]|nr:phosphoribosyltransferase family protein [Candidimonas sp.]